MRNHYEAVVQDLVERRLGIVLRLKELQKEQESLLKDLTSLDPILEGVRRYLASWSSTASAREARTLLPYAAMSMRWATLKLASTRSEEEFATGTIAGELLAGGFPGSQNFSSKVSAILGQMTNRGEMERTPNGWRVSSAGLKVWENISSSERYRNRVLFIDEGEQSEDVGDPQASVGA